MLVNISYQQWFLGQNTPYTQCRNVYHNFNSSSNDVVFALHLQTQSALRSCSCPQAAAFQYGHQKDCYITWKPSQWKQSCAEHALLQAICDKAMMDYILLGHYWFMEVKKILVRGCFLACFLLSLQKFKNFTELRFLFCSWTTMQCGQIMEIHHWQHWRGLFLFCLSLFLLLIFQMS